MALDRYRQKRSADRTPEPFGRGGVESRGPGAGFFVVQKHAARRLHYDFRLGMEGVLRSWAIPKGPSLNPGDRRLAVMVEDHPLEYGDFEGLIPEGNYGAGAVIVWDRGEYRALDPPDDAARAVREGKLDLAMRGFKLRGAFTLVRIRNRRKQDSSDKQQWLLIKKRDEYASGEDLVALHPRSVLSGLTVEQIRQADALGREVTEQLARLGAPALAGPLTPRSFPLTLAKSAEEPFDGDEWLFEIKYDGVRALALRDGAHTRLIARSGADITAQYPEVALAFDALPFERFVMDGEIVAPDDRGRPSFQLLQRRISVHEPREIARLSLAAPVSDFVFDLPAFADFDLRPLKLELRKQLLARLIDGEGPLRYCDHYLGAGRDFYRAVAEAGLEGMVAKRRDSPYRGKRTGEWLKVKCPLTRRFVIGGYTEPEGTRPHFGALMVGQYEADGQLRFVGRVGTGFDEAGLRRLADLMDRRKAAQSPFRRPRQGEPSLPRKVHFCEPDLVCEVRFTEWTNDGAIRQPSFRGLVEGVDPRECRYEGPMAAGASEASGVTPARTSSSDTENDRQQKFTVTNPGKVFWPAEGYTKGDLIAYYETIARWMMPYLKDRPVMLVRYPDGIEGKSFYQKDAPGFAPKWLRTEKIYSEDSKREIAYFILESPAALGYVANLGAIPLHIWSSRVPHLERPDWLLFDIDPKGSTTECAVKVAQAVGVALKELGLRPYVKTSGQMGLHVVVGLKLDYTYQQARMFSELVARLVVSRIPELATLNRDLRGRKGRVYIDYLQLGHGKTIVAPFAVRPVAHAPVSAPLSWKELSTDLNPADYNIRTMPRRMARLRRDPFIGALEDPQSLEAALPRLEAALGDDRPPARSG